MTKIDTKIIEISYPSGRVQNSSHICWIQRTKYR